MVAPNIISAVAEDSGLRFMHVALLTLLLNSYGYIPTNVTTKDPGLKSLKKLRPLLY